MKKETLILLLLLALPSCIIAQLASRMFARSNFSLEFNGGAIGSFQDFKTSSSHNCDKGCLGYLTYYEPVYTRHLSLKTNLYLTDRHRLSLGFSISKHGYKKLIYRTQTNRIDTYNFLHDYSVTSLGYFYKFLQSRILSLGIGNDMQYEKLNDKANHAPEGETGISQMGYLELGLHPLKKLAFSIKIIERTALTKFGSISFDGQFHRFGTGLLLGIEYRLGKIKYDSPEEQ